MQIILLSNKRRKTLQFELTRRQMLTASLVTMLGITFLFFFGGVLFNTSEVGLNKISEKNVVELNEQRKELDRLREKTRNTLDSFALRVGQMQAQMTRLNAVGEHLAKKAKLDNTEFNFDNLPAQGGVEDNAFHESFNEGQLMSDIDHLDALMSLRTEQFKLLNYFSANKNLSKTVRPAGLPVEKGWLSSHFGYRVDPFTGKKAFHNGVDIAGKKGTGVLAVASGVVTWADKRNGYGNLVEIDHGAGFITRYGHNEKIIVKVGDVVRSNQKIAAMGSTGRSTGPHVHFEVIKNGKKINPRKYLYASR